VGGDQEKEEVLITPERAALKLRSEGEKWRVKQVGGRRYLQKWVTQWEYVLSGEQFGDLVASYKDHDGWQLYCKVCGRLSSYPNVSRILSGVKCKRCAEDVVDKELSEALARRTSTESRLRKRAKNYLHRIWRSADISGFEFEYFRADERVKDSSYWKCSCKRCGFQAAIRATELVSGKTCQRCGTRISPKKKEKMLENGLVLYNKVWLTAARESKICMWSSHSDMVQTLGDISRFTPVPFEFLGVIGICYKEFLSASQST